MDNRQVDYAEEIARILLAPKSEVGFVLGVNVILIGREGLTMTPDEKKRLRDYFQHTTPYQLVRFL